ncbi:HAMP domain-containing sensor histidine kinase [Nocardioides sp. CER19]|uniref:HAMP domain-containing sensor histidine kinase n=1 Tax=Nocardioides sp. CER19 TaxID=3038538 RepID=UPI002446C407|nr:HAMP domain-containing sensor histidine kinase [Nocardioides sp. CER19]MDH2413307.1 HAMP domain-containing sensor histidine kinase [Nocardioides sp. CER19]
MAESLQLAAESLCAFGGFGAAVISAVRDDQVVTIAVAGADRFLDAGGGSVEVGHVLGRSSPASVLRDQLLPHADRWGLLHYLPHGRTDVTHVGWRVDRDYTGSAWHPDDMLLAPVHDDRGTLRGVISLDGPVDGQLPPPERRPLLEHYVAQAARILVTAVEREELAERLRLLDVAREAMRQAARTPSPQEALTEATPGLVEGFGLAGLHATVFGTPDPASSDELLTPLGRLYRELSPGLWRAQHVAVMGRTQQLDAPGGAEERTLVRDFLERADLESVLLVPMGAGQACLGSLAFSRAVGAPPWSREERRVAQDVGRDLGRLIADSEALHREQRLVRELRELDTYKRELVAAISHELRTPIASILSNAELIGSTDDDDDVRRGVAAMERGARRMSGLVTELLLLARLDEPGRELAATPVDLEPVVREVVDLQRGVATLRGVEIDSRCESARTVGDALELATVAGNLIGNAVKYSRPGDVVRVSVRRADDEVELAVVDEGIGITEQDRSRLFGEFQRGTDPEALSQPGTGLGLAIVDRIVRRHGGRVDVASSPGAGSRFRVLLPGA